MNFSIGLSFITGMMLGIEFVDGDEEDPGNLVVFDLLILRLVFRFHPNN